MSLTDPAPRLSVQITEAQHLALKRMVPYALKSPLIRAMLDTLIQLLMANPSSRLSIITCIIAGEIDIAESTFEKVSNGRKELIG